MAKRTFAVFMQAGQAGMRQALAVLASGQNPDGTAFTLDTTGGGGGSFSGALTAGEAHVGSVGGTSDSITPTLTLSTTAYTIDDCIGGKLTLTGALRSGGPGTGILESIFLTDKSGQKPGLRIFLFNANPTNGTYTDNSPIAFGTDVSMLSDVLTVTAGDWYGPHGTTATYVCSVPVQKIVKAASGTTLYAAMALLTAPTLLSTSDITAKFKFSQD